MQPIHSFKELSSHLQQLGRRIRLAVVCGSDAGTAEAVMRAVNEGFAEAIFVGDCDEVKACPQVAGADPLHIKYIEATSHEEAAERAVRLVREGQADVLVKGLLHTATLLRAVHNKEWGLLPPGKAHTHVTMAEVST